MTDEDIEDIRERKLKELKERANSQSNQDQLNGSGSSDEESQSEQIESVLRQFVTSDARQRLNTAELVNPEIVKQVKKELVQAYQMNKIQSKITEDQVKQILSEAKDQTSQSFNIQRR